MIVGISVLIALTATIYPRFRPHGSSLWTRSGMSNETPAAVEARALWKSFMGGDGHELAVLEGVELSVEAGEVVAVVGSSGAGSRPCCTCSEPSTGRTRVRS